MTMHPPEKTTPVLIPDEADKRHGLRFSNLEHQQRNWPLHLAAYIWSIPMDEVTPQQEQRAKELAWSYLDLKDTSDLPTRLVRVHRWFNQ